MLDHLHIQNYRLFKDLKIDKLGQVNLIAGKNNTGKTALLEALRIWKSKGESSVVNNIIFSRGQWRTNHDRENYLSLFKYINNVFSNFRAIALDSRKRNSIFNESHITIKINDLEIGFSDGKSIGKVNFEQGFYVEYKEPGTILGKPLKKTRRKKIKGEVNAESPFDNLIYIPFLSPFYAYDILVDSLDIDTEKEIVSILKIIEPKIEDFRFKLDSKEPIIKLDIAKERVPLKNLGDGANRLFKIALALVNAKDNILIVDEFEVGLHHSVQEQLWDIIFKYAKEWNIQVFVTTHSQDTVKAFAEVWNQSAETIKMGNYFRLQRSRENPELIEPIYYDNEMLEFAYQKHIETR